MRVVYDRFCAALLASRPSDALSITKHKDKKVGLRIKAPPHFIQNVGSDSFSLCNRTGVNTLAPPGFCSRWPLTGRLVRMDKHHIRQRLAIIGRTEIAHVKPLSRLAGDAP